MGFLRKNISVKAVAILIFLIINLIPASASAGTANQKFNSSLDATRRNAGYTSGALTKTPAEMVGRVVGIMLSVIGVLLLLLLIYGGFVWMNARGAEAEVENAKKIIQNAIIGLVVVLLAYAIAAFVAVFKV